MIKRSKVGLVREALHGVWGGAPTAGGTLVLYYAASGVPLIVRALHPWFYVVLPYPKPSYDCAVLAAASSHNAAASTRSARVLAVASLTLFLIILPLANLIARQTRSARCSFVGHVVSQF